MSGGLLRTCAGGTRTFWCPGCKTNHAFAAGWTVSGPDDAPTVTPSVLTTNGHHLPGFKSGDPCWCTFNAAHPGDPSPFECQRCHLHIRAGKLVFLPDCTHALAGTTVGMEER